MTQDNNFANYVTSVAFHLSLSKQMAACLHHIDCYERLWRATKDKHEKSKITLSDAIVRTDRGYDAFIPAVKALERRGLVKFERPKTADGNHDWAALSYSITEPGQHVLALCRLAGLIPAYEGKVIKMKRAAS